MYRSCLLKHHQNNLHYNPDQNWLRVHYSHPNKHYSHLQPFKGRAHVAYIPTERIVGISKLARIVDLHARKLQNQERITKGIADDLEENLQPLGAAVIIEASHGCMQCRGVKKQNSIMTTSAMRGVFFDKSEARTELMQLIRSSPLSN